MAEIMQGIEEEEFVLIIDNAQTYPFMRWFRLDSVTLKEMTPYSPDLNPIKQICSHMKAMLHNDYSELLLMKWPKNRIRKTIEEVVTFCWKDLIFDSLTEFIVHRIEAIIDADEWYTKY